MMRLAFSMMIESDADVMLIDEVLAVGDASFNQKCVDTLQRLRSEGRTILLVTHAMESLKSLCDHAILIENGIIDLDGDPERSRGATSRSTSPVPSRRRRRARTVRGAAAARIADVWLENSEGERVKEFEHGSAIHLVAVIEAKEEIDRPQFGFEICASDRARVFAVVRHPFGTPTASWSRANGSRSERRSRTRSPPTAT